MSTSEIPERIGPYRVIERLGMGGMGEVFRAFDTRLERAVALKRLLAPKSGAGSPKRRREDLRREARAAARLDHPSLVRVHDLLESEEGDWLVLELIEGQPLSSLLQQGPLEPETAVTLAADLAEGLLALQDAGLVHNDIKAENVIITGGGRVKMLDFGLAEGFEDLRQGQPGKATVRGTPRAMAPERILGRAGRPESDLFSLGVLLYEMLTGRAPWRAADGSQTLARVLAEEAPPILELAPRTPPELARWVHRMIDKEPSKRPGVREIATVLGAMAQSSASDFRSTPAPDSNVGSTGSMVAPGVGARELASPDEPSTRLAGWRMTPPSLRRLVTVMCCRLAAGDGRGQLETEALFDVLPIFQRLAAAVVDLRGGYLLHLGGHRLVVCFGYPKAHEFAVDRAVAAALGLARGVEASDQARRHHIRARIGVHCGFALELTGVRRRLVLGPTGERARQLEGLADPGAVLVSAETHDLLSCRFESAELGGRLQVDGRIRPAAASATPGGASGSETIGRDHESALLTEAVDGLSHGTGRTLLLVGEGGMGKTHLLRFCRARASAEVSWLQAGGVPDEPGDGIGGPGLGPILLRQSLQEAGHDPSPESLRAELEGYEDGEIIASLLAPWLDSGASAHGVSAYQGPMRRGPSGAGESTPDESTPVESTPDDVRQAWLAWIAHRARRRAMVIAIEDLQWVPEGDLSWMLELAHSSSDDPVTLLLTARPGFRWPGAAPISRLTLGELGREACEALLARVAPGLEPAARERWLERAAGVPGDLVALASQPDGAVPLAVRSRLEARLERLGEKRWLAQIAAAPGGADRWLMESLLGDGPAGDDRAGDVRAEAPGENTGRFERQIEELTAAGVLEAAGPGRWRFSRELLREVAWDCLLPADQELILGGIRASAGETTRVDGPLGR